MKCRGVYGAISIKSGLLLILRSYSKDDPTLVVNRQQWVIDNWHPTEQSGKATFLIGAKPWPAGPNQALSWGFAPLCQRTRSEWQWEAISVEHATCNHHNDVQALGETSGSGHLLKLLPGIRFLPLHLVLPPACLYPTLHNVS